MAEVVTLASGLNLMTIADQEQLHTMMDATEDFEDRKKIRNRLKDVMAEARAQREEMVRKREQEREDAIRNRLRDAEEQKKRTLQMYDAMAKSAPAGGHKTMDVNILREGKASTPSTPTGVDGPNLNGGRKGSDLVEDAIRSRQREADDNKRKILAAYDQAAKSGPAGSTRFIDFENVSQESIKKQSISSSSTTVRQVSAMSKFQQMDNAIAPKAGAPEANKFLARSPTAIKEMLLKWCKSKTKEYDNVSIDNFSSSWADGMAFCALIHHFYPDAFDYSTLDPKNRRFNFDLGFRVAEEQADIAPLLDTDDMIMMKNKPDWKCVFTYVQSIYRRLREMD